jgi:hypothetical protein
MFIFFSMYTYIPNKSTSNKYIEIETKKAIGKKIIFLNFVVVVFIYILYTIYSHFIYLLFNI